ncbi:MAG: hypothetical protein ACD_79C00526G0001, partial [uncultured bacterium]
MQYDSGLAEAQPSSYTSMSYDTNTGLVTLSEWKDGKYWTEEDVNNDPKKGSEFTSGSRVKEKLASYTEESTYFYPTPGQFDAWTKNPKDFMFLDDEKQNRYDIEKVEDLWVVTGFTEEQFDSELDSKVNHFNKDYLTDNGFEEGVTSKTERSEMRYYTELDEKENKSHIKDQIGSYHEIRSAIEGRFSDAPGLVTELDWYGAEYDWAFKHEKDRKLTYRVGESEEYIDDFQRTDYEKENEISISVITGYKEHTTDNIKHDSSREWSTFVNGGISDDGTWEMASGYDKYGRVLEYKELSTSVEGTNNAHRWNIQYWDWDNLKEAETPFFTDDYQQRWNYGQVKSYEEQSDFVGVYSHTNTVQRDITCYDSYGRLLGYEEYSSTDGIESGIAFIVLGYREDGWVSNLMREYRQETVSDDVTTITNHYNESWDQYGQVLVYHETIETDTGEGVLITEIIRHNVYYENSYLLQGYQEFVSEKGYINGELQFAEYSFHQRWNMQYNEYNQLISYTDINITGLSEEFWKKTFGASGSGYGTAGIGVFPSFDAFSSNLSLTSDLDSMISFLDGVFGEWGVATLSNRYNIAYNSSNQMTDYEEDSWRFGKTEVGIPVLDENGEMVADPETGEILTRKAYQKLDVRYKTKWFGALYDSRGRVVSYNQMSWNSVSPAVNEYTEFRNGTYDKFGRQLGFVETTYLTGTYMDGDMQRQLNSVSIRERVGAYTKYNGLGMLFSYKDIMTDANGAVSEAYQLDAKYDYRRRVISYTQENKRATGAYSRVEVTKQTYNNLGQVLSYLEETFNFSSHGDLRSRVVTDRKNSLYNSLGQAIYNYEISQTFTGSSALSDNA